jgi:2-oxoglutarate ferredoxin oxidoreductase subunit alpha
MVMMDEVVGHMTEKVVIPSADQLDVTPRRFTKKVPGEYLPYKSNGDGVPDMVKAGDGYNFHITGLTHDERGYPNMTVSVQDKLVKRLRSKIDNAPDLVCYEADGLEGADVVVVSYGITSRVAQRAIDLGRAQGLKVGKLRLIIAWPFPEMLFAELASKVKGFVVAELNLGQMVNEVQRAANGAAKVRHVGHAGGSVHDPQVILKAIQEVAR